MSEHELSVKVVEVNGEQLVQMTMTFDQAEVICGLISAFTPMIRAIIEAREVLTNSKKKDGPIHCNTCNTWDTYEVLPRQYNKEGDRFLVKCRNCPEEEYWVMEEGDERDGRV